jgi:hypothetical protein
MVSFLVLLKNNFILAHSMPTFRQASKTDDFFYFFTIFLPNCDVLTRYNGLFDTVGSAIGIPPLAIKTNYSKQENSFFAHDGEYY